MSITTFAGNCTKNSAGNYDKWFACLASDIDELTFVDEKVTVITMELNKDFGMLKADLDGVQYISEGTGKRGYVNEQQLITKYTKKTTELEKLVKELTDGVVCGIVAIRIDSNGTGWISGVAPTDRFFQNRPWLEIEDNFDTGESNEDWEEGNKYTVTLKRMSSVKEYELDSGLVDSLADGTAAFVDWPAAT